MIDIEQNLPLWLQPAQIFTLHQSAQDERQHGPGNDPAFPAPGHPDHAANSLAYKLDLFTRAARVVAVMIAGMTIAAISFCILAT